MKSSHTILMTCIVLAFSGCRTLEDAVQVIGKGDSPAQTTTRLPIPGSAPAAEGCGTPTQLIQTVKAAQKKNAITAEKTYDGKWCRLSGKLTDVGTYSVSIYSHNAIHLDNKLACIQSDASDMMHGGSSSPPEVRRQSTKDVREKLIDMKGQKIEIVGQIKLGLQGSQGSQRYFPLVHCQVVSPKI
ncbi:MAG: hypothetical protein LBF51_05000 [Zoogloeaceae bacterium]|jgi:hypothetical protein|nr:hypothetical protein [Zoogloeaceae bacterium]